MLIYDILYVTTRTFCVGCWGTQFGSRRLLPQQRCSDVTSQREGRLAVGVMPEMRITFFECQPNTLLVSGDRPSSCINLDMILCAHLLIDKAFSRPVLFISLQSVHEEKTI